MQVLDAVKRMMVKSGTSGTALSVAIGKDRNAVSTMMSRSSTPRVDTLVKMCDAMGYWVVLESKDDRIVVDLASGD